MADENERVQLLGPAVAPAVPRPTNAGLIVAIFSVLTLLNRMLLTIQYSFTSYPVFVTLYWTCVLAPAFYALHRWHTRTTPLTAAELSIPWYVWWIIGALSSVDSLIVGLSASHLKDFGSLQVLLTRGTIPISLAVTKIIFPQTAYARNQYAGATLVLLGLCVALLPGLLSSEAVPLSLLPWVGFYLSHCIPLAVGQIYSEYILKTYSCNEYYANWMQSVPSIFITLILLVPSSAIDGVIPADLPDNLWRGLRCQFGVTPPGDESCTLAPVFTHAYIFVNIAWNTSSTLTLATLGANVWFMISALLVPVTAVAFSIPGIPGSKPITVFTFLGLALLSLGIATYSFWDATFAFAKALWDESLSCFPATRAFIFSLPQQQHAALKSYAEIPDKAAVSGARLQLIAKQEGDL